MSTIYEAIKEDHDKQRDIADALNKTEGDSAERQRLFKELETEVTSHAVAEEQTLYADLIGDADTQEKARHSISEHKEADEILEELKDLEFDNPAWLGKFRKLKKELEHHMRE